MTPPASRWTEIKAMFEVALQRPANEREALIDAAGLDEAAAAEVRSLLQHHDAATGGSDFLESPAVPAPEAANAAHEGQRLGAWAIVRPLGAGGMGEVFEARRADGQYDGRAAVKLLKRGMDSAAVLQRFALERQALARLSHPHIARLLDAGASSDGLPYFVLEYVDGQPIDEAVRGLPLEARLRLFLQLADAVAHAHRRLLVHRDLKPGNVLVDGEGQVKLLDFGIAKALDPLEGADGSATLGGVRPYTPHYASPEQVRGEPVTTATDIYSLGVLLYQMLTGTRPTGRTATTPAEAARSVLEDEPTRPSRLSPDQAADPQWLATRKRLEGDLDNILLKALEKPIERRYVSVDALAEDILRFLDGRPVSARAATPAYVLAKFVRRHRLGVAGGGLALLAVLGSAGVAWRQAAVAEMRLANIGTITRDVVLKYGDAMTSMSGGLAVKEQMLQGLIGQLERLVQEAGDDPVWQADLAGAYARLAEVQGNDTGLSVGKPAAALPNAERAIALAERAWPRRQGDARLADAYASALQIRAQAQRAQGDAQAGVPSLEKALTVLDATLPQTSGPAARELRLRQAGLQLTLAQLHDQQSIPSLNQPERALELYGRAEQTLLALDQAQAALDSGNLLGTLYGGRALTQARLNRLDAARADMLQALRFRERAVEAEPGNVVFRDGLVTEATNAGVVLMRAEDPAGALRATTLAWDQVRALARENGPGNQWLEHRPRVAAHHGRALLLNGRAADALPVLQEALAMWRGRHEAKPTPHTRRMVAWMSLQQARAEHGSGRSAAGLALAHAQLPVLEELAQAPKARDAMLNVGEACRFLAEADPGSPAARQAWRARSREAYARAHALLPLTGDLLAQFRSVGG